MKTIDYSAALALRQMAVVQDELPKYLLAPVSGSSSYLQPCPFSYGGIPVWLGRMGPLRLTELSSICRVDTPRLSRLLDVMAERHVVSIGEAGYSLSEEAGPLADEDSLESLWVLCELGEEYWRMWPDYPSSLHSDSSVSAFENQHGEPFFSFLRSRPALKDTFDRLMAKITEELSTELVCYIECDAQAEVVDVGGGQGVLMKKLHQRYDLKSATVLDVYSGNSRTEEGIEYLDGNFWMVISLQELPKIRISTY